MRCADDCDGRCYVCDGGQECPTCEGEGRVEVERVAVRWQLEPRYRLDECPACHGDGLCRECEGSGRCQECAGVTA